MDDLATFEISLSAQGNTVVLNGQDISHLVASVNVAKPGPLLMPSVVLEIPSDQVKVTGSGVAYFDQQRPSAIEFLQTLDPRELEQEALTRSDFGSSLTELLLQILRERADAQP